MKTLNEHIRHAEDYFQHRVLYKQYKQQNPSNQEAFYEHHRAELAVYESAARYLKRVMNGHSTILTKTWRNEAASLISRKEKLYAEYLLLKEEVRETEVLWRCVEQIAQEKKPTLQIKKYIGLE